jgi:hypothetical protein
MQTIPSWLRPLAFPAAALALVACSEGAQRSPLAPPEAAQLATTTGATLIECPTDTTRSISKTIDLLGGTLELDGHKIVIPEGAVLVATEFTLTVPASNYVEIGVKADGAEHFQFEEPVSMTISYERCTRSNIEKSDLRIFYIDSDNAILEEMGGTDDKTARTVSTSTDHLSDYAIGAN